MDGFEGLPQGVFVHSHGLCESPTVGAGTRIWAFAHVLKGARIGRDCNICDHVFIENDVVVGDAVTIKSGVQLWDGARLGDNVFIGPNVTFTNDPFPRSRQRPDRFLAVILEDGACVGANATILPGLAIGKSAMVGAGAVVTRSVPPNAIVVGNPARIVGYRDAERRSTKVTAASTAPGRQEALGIGRSEIWHLRHFSDLRGAITPLEHAADLPFIPTRSFLVYGVPTTEVRGEHAHRACQQFLIAASGTVSVIVDDGRNRREVILEHPTTGLWLPALVWAVQHKFEPTSVLLVLASHPYDPNDYIRDYAVFLETVAQQTRYSRAAVR